MVDDKLWREAVDHVFTEFERETRRILNRMMAVVVVLAVLLAVVAI